MPRKTPQIKGKAPKEDVPAAPGPKPDLTRLSRARVLLKKGTALFDSSDYKGAAPALEQALDLMNDAKAGPEDRLEVILSLAILNMKAGNLDKSEALTQEAMRLIAAPNIPVALKGQANYMNGVVLLKRGDLDAAQKHFERALNLFEAGHNKERMAQIFKNLGNVCFMKCQFSKAIIYNNRSIKIFQELGLDGDVWRTRHNVALSLGLQGDYPEGLKIMEDALDNFTRLKDPGMVAMCLSNLGFFHLRMGHYDRALQNYEESSRMCRELGDLWTDAYNVIGTVEMLIARGDKEGAQRTLDENYKTLMTTKSKDITGRAMKARGILHRERGDIKKAEDDFALAERLLSEGQYQIFLAEDYIEWAKAALKAGDEKRAMALFEKAGAIYRQLSLPLLDKDLGKIMEQCGL